MSGFVLQATTDVKKQTQGSVDFGRIGIWCCRSSLQEFCPWKYNDRWYSSSL